MLRRGLIIALVGVDGSGKSSAARALASDPRFTGLSVRQMYFGANGFWIPRVVEMNQSCEAVPLLRFVPRALMSLDRQLRLIPALYHRSRGRLVLCDRYYHDDVVARHVATEMGGSQSPLRRAAGGAKAFFRPRMLYRPDHTFYLDVTPLAAYERKQDYGFEVMLTLNGAYREIMSRMRDVTFINADQPLEKVHDALSVAVQRVMNWRVKAAAATGSWARHRHFLGRRLASLFLAAPLLRPLGLSILYRSAWWHPAVDMPVKELREIIAGLDRNHGRGTLRLTAMGVLHHEAGEWVRMIPLGRSAAAALSLAHRNWRKLTESQYADLVDYRFITEEEGPRPVYAVERLRPLRGGSTATDRVRDRLRGEFVEDQFRNLPFDDLVGELSISVGLSPEQSRRLKVQPEAGLHGVTHGDLHLANLLQNAAGRTVMIDLDRVREGPQVLDMIHAAVVAIETAQRRHWLRFFSLDIESWPGGAPLSLRAASPNSLLAYFIWRQSVELRAMPAPPRAYLRRLKDCCERLTLPGRSKDRG